MIELIILPAAASSIRRLPPDIKHGIKQAIRAIATDSTCGEPLQRELAGYLKFRVRRFRVVYSIDREHRVVTIVAVGPRATIYEALARRASRGR